MYIKLLEKSLFKIIPMYLIRLFSNNLKKSYFEKLIFFFVSIIYLEKNLAQTYSIDFEKFIYVL